MSLSSDAYGDLELHCSYMSEDHVSHDPSHIFANTEVGAKQNEPHLAENVHAFACFRVRKISK